MSEKDHGGTSLTADATVSVSASDAATARRTEACPACCGYGLIEEVEYVTRDMAIDAGDLRWEGEPMRSEHVCPECGGAGEFEIEAEIENTDQTVSEASGSVPSAAQTAN